MADMKGVVATRMKLRSLFDDWEKTARAAAYTMSSREWELLATERRLMQKSPFTACLLAEVHRDVVLWAPSRHTVTHPRSSLESAPKRTSPVVAFVEMSPYSSAVGLSTYLHEREETGGPRA